MKVTFDLSEKNDADCAFFALYAGLRMYMDFKNNQSKEKGAFSVTALEASSLLKDMELQYPNEFAEAELEYETVYG